MIDRRRFGFLSAFAFVLLAAAFFLRTTGIHIDATNYLNHALQSPYGDSALTGKPLLFYAFNYAFINGIGWLWGPLRPISLHVFYVALFAVSLAWTVTAIQTKDSALDSLLRVSIISISSIALVNATMLMMESAALPLITLAFGCILTGASTRGARSCLVVSSALATAVKSTTVPGLLLLAWAFRDRLRGRAVLIPIGIAIGVTMNGLVLWFIGPHGDGAYGGLGALLSPPLISGRLTRTGEYFALWLFFVGVNLAVVALAAPFQTLRDRPFQILALGSLAAVFLVQFASTYEFARYCYPVMWVAFLGVLLSADVRNRSLAVSLLALQIAAAAPLFMASIDRFRFWPRLVTGEMIDSGGTVFPGFPIYGMAVRQLLHDSHPCVWINSDNGEKNEVLEEFAALTFPDSRILVSPAFERDGDCSPSNTIRLWREHVDSPDAGCTVSCGRCEFQKVGYFAVKPGWVRNQMCWPATAIATP